METEKERFVILRAKGNSFDSIAKEMKRSKGTLISWNKELKESISRLKSIQLESLCERYFLSHQSKIKLYGELLLKVNKEFNKRKLESLSTEKLLDLLIKFHTLLKEEYIEPSFFTDDEIEVINNSERFFEDLMDRVDF